MSASTTDPHKSEDLLHPDHHHIQKHVRSYLIVGGLLLVFTGITVGLAYVDFGSETGNIVVAMIVATIKALLVALVFMHLMAEKLHVYRILALTIFFVLGLFLLTWLHYADPIRETTESEPVTEEAAPM